MRYDCRVAFLTSGRFYLVTFLPTSDSAWAAMSPIPALPNGLVDAVVNGTPLPMYVVDSSSGYAVFAGGIATGLDDSLVDSTLGPYTPLTTTDDQSREIHWGVDGSGTVYTYGIHDPFLHSYPPSEITALKAFLP